MPPGPFGGNLDIKALTEGSSLWLPVQVEGALLSLGDPHAAQGNGEVAGTAIECPMEVTVRVTLHKHQNLTRPHLFAPPRAAGRPALFSAVGVAPHLMEAAREALRGVVGFLAKRHQMAPLDAYVLASVVADLTIAQVVNVPNWTVTASVPL